MVALLVALALPACTQLIDDGDDVGVDAMHSQARYSVPTSAEDNKEMADFIGYMEMLAAIDEEDWDRVFTEVTRTTASSPTPENQLRLALVLCRADRPPGD